MYTVPTGLGGLDENVFSLSPSSILFSLFYSLSSWFFSLYKFRVWVYLPSIWDYSGFLNSSPYHSSLYSLLIRSMQYLYHIFTMNLLLKALIVTGICTVTGKYISKKITTFGLFIPDLLKVIPKSDYCLLKGQCHNILPQFLSNSYHSLPLFHTLKYFAYGQD